MASVGKSGGLETAHSNDSESEEDGWAHIAMHCMMKNTKYKKLQNTKCKKLQNTKYKKNENTK